MDHVIYYKGLFESIQENGSIVLFLFLIIKR